MGKVKKVLLFVVLPVLVIVPFVAISGWGMARIERYAIENRKEDWGRTLLFRVAGVYANTFREVEAAHDYHRFVHFYSEHSCTHEPCAIKAEIDAERLRAAGMGGGQIAGALVAVDAPLPLPLPGQPRPQEDPRIAEAYFNMGLYTGEAGNRDQATLILRQFKLLYPEHQLITRAEGLIVRFENFRR